MRGRGEGVSRRGDPDGGWGAEGAVRGDPGYRRARRWRRGSAAAGSLGDLGQVTSRAPGSLRCLPGEDGCRGRQRAFPRRDTPPHPPPPRCPSAGPGRSGGTGPLEPGAGRLPGKRRCRLRSAPCSEGDVGVRCPGTAGTGGDAPRKAPTHT